MAQGLFSSGTTSVARPTEPSTGSVTYSNTASPTVTFAFTPAVVGAAATAWTVTSNATGDTILKTTATGASQTFTYLAGGTAEVSVSAVNANGTSGRKTTIGTINNAPVITFDWMAVAGGGAGGFAYGAASGERYATGGGGAGGYRTGNSTSILSDSGFTLNLTVGAGGAQAASGGNSRIGTYNVTGGGRGATTGAATQQVAASTGGSGGAGGAADPNRSGAAGNAGSYSPVEGFGGGGGSSNQNTGGGGGGGASADGASNSGQIGGAGGAGANNTTFNINVAGGGGGGAGYFESGATGTGGAGGAGGGGAGNGNGVGTSGTTNLGGGGGGSRGNVGGGSTGGSGVIRIKTYSGFTATFTGGVTQTNSTTGGITTYVITAAGAADTVTFS